MQRISLPLSLSFSLCDSFPPCHCLLSCDGRCVGVISAQMFEAPFSREGKNKITWYGLVGNVVSIAISCISFRVACRPFALPFSFCVCRWRTFRNSPFKSYVAFCSPSCCSLRTLASTPGYFDAFAPCVACRLFLCEEMQRRTVRSSCYR